MHKLPKGFAITGGILNIFTSFLAIIVLVGYSTISTTALDWITGILNLPALILLSVVLFRRKPDTFAAVVCFLQVLVAALSAVSICIRLSGYRSGDLLIWADLMFIIGNLAKGLSFAFMAMRCIRKETGKSGAVLWSVLAAVAFSIFGGALNGAAPYMSAGQMDAAGVIILMAGGIGAVVGSLPNLFAGLAFYNIRTETVYPSYGQYPPQYPYQQYQAPQYQAPQYRQPQYQQPQYQQPQYQQPQYQAPQYQQPQYQAPQAPSQEQ